MRRGFGLHDRHSPFRFDPATLFIGGAIKGSFYNPSDVTTLYQDDAGTTPVTAFEQTVGRIIDLSGNGNHATQSVAASRPAYSAKYNLLTFTELFTNAAWSTFVSGVGVAPVINSTGVISNVSFNCGNLTSSSNRSAFRQFFTCAPSTPLSLRFQLRAGTPSDVGRQLRVVVESLSSNSQIVTLTANFQTISISHTTGSASTSGQILFETRGTFVNSAVANIDFTQIDIRRTIDTVSLPTYQRVAAANSYDTAGFPAFLAFDGSNDSMLTSAIDFTGTNKMTVFAGAAKLSDAAQAVVAELSATIASNNGTFLLSAPNSAAANYNFSSKGTTQVDNTVTTYTAPNTAVLTGQADIAAPSNIIRVNGAQAGSVATTQGTGNFGNYALNIGRRNNATLPFNGRLYGLIVLGAAASDWQVFAVEKWMAGKTGISI